MKCPCDINLTVASLHLSLKIVCGRAHREQVRLDKLVDTRDYVDPESISRLKAETPALRDNLALLKKSLREHVS